MMRKGTLALIIVLSALMFYVGCDDEEGGGAPGAPGSGGPKKAAVPQTGQTTCWDPILTEPILEIPCTDAAAQGEDGAVQAGVMPPDPRFTDNGDGTITDNLTRLIWLKNANCLGGRRTWRPALEFANALEDGECGLSDGSMAGEWRLPNRKELESLLDLGNFNPSLPSGNPFIDVQLMGLYWSSTTFVQIPDFGWRVDLANSSILHGDKRDSQFVLPVRDAQGAPGKEKAPAPVPQTGQTTCWDPMAENPPPVIPCTDAAAQGEDGAVQAGVMPPNRRFKDNGDGTITDNLTRLIWLKSANCGGTRTWGAALDFANGLEDGECGLSDGSMAGDWRLPNRKELESLLDLGNFNPALPSGHPFIDVQDTFGYWSSTTVFGDPLRAFGCPIEDGRILITHKSTTNWVLPVRDGF